jgi:hypothetical protein
MITNFTEWEASVPDTIKADSLWKVRAYKLALLLADISWLDVTKLMGDKRTMSLSDPVDPNLRSHQTRAPALPDGRSAGVRHASQSASNAKRAHFRLNLKSIGPKAGASVPKSCGAIPKTGASVPKGCGTIPKGCGTIPRAGANVPKGCEAIPKTGAGVPKSCRTIPRAGAGVPKSCGTIPKPAQAFLKAQ